MNSDVDGVCPGKASPHEPFQHTQHNHTCTNTPPTSVTTSAHVVSLDSPVQAVGSDCPVHHTQEDFDHASTNQGRTDPGDGGVGRGASKSVVTSGDCSPPRRAAGGTWPAATQCSQPQGEDASPQDGNCP